jgi:hypothetical protein
MRVLVSGSTGFIGSALITALHSEGHTVARLVRPGAGPGSSAAAREQNIAWDPVAGKFDAAAAEGADALVHLAGASIADCRWNDSRKRLLRTSRVDATRHLIGELAKLQRPPRVIVGASAIGYYGSRGDETLTEASAPGNDFLSGICREWEAEVARGSVFGARVAHVRFGIVLDKDGGALPKMALPFKLGAGGRLGDGRQWQSWVSLPDTVNAIQFALKTDAVSGPVNIVSPNPVRNSEFTRLLARTLHRPALFPAPAFALRLALGEMADALLLSSQKAAPTKLLANGYTFLHPELAGALAQLYCK